MNSKSKDANNYWIEYRTLVPINKDPSDSHEVALRDSILHQALPLASRIVAKMAKSMPSHVDKDDLESYAKIGLMQAITRFNHELGVPFEAYAVTKMRSAVLDGIRALDWAPRSLRRKEREVHTAHQSLRQELSKEPTRAELADKLNLSETELSTINKKSLAAQTTSLESEVDGLINYKTQNELSADENSLALELRDCVVESLQQLPFKEALVVVLHYYEEMKLADIGKLLQISDVKVRVLHAEAVLFIWQKLEDLRN